MMVGLIDPSREWPSYDERGNALRVRLHGRIARTSASRGDDFVLAHTRNIKRECPGSERTSRNSEITAAAFQTDPVADIFARIASHRERKKRSISSATDQYVIDSCSVQQFRVFPVIRDVSLPHLILFFRISILARRANLLEINRYSLIDIDYGDKVFSLSRSSRICVHAKRRLWVNVATRQTDTLLNTFQMWNFIKTL